MHISFSMRPKPAAESQLTKSPVSRTGSGFNPLVMVMRRRIVRAHEVADVNVKKLSDAKQDEDFGQTRQSDAPMSNLPSASDNHRRQTPRMTSPAVTISTSPRRMN